MCCFVHCTFFQVKLTIRLKDLGLNDEQLKRFIVLLGPRYNWRKREVSLVAEKFANRIENKRLAIYCHCSFD